jgi:hypothetical protein
MTSKRWFVAERLKVQDLIPAEVQEYFYNDKTIAWNAISFAISYKSQKFESR